MNTTSKITKKAQMYQLIAQHGANLNNIFNTTFSDVDLCKKLHKLEAKAHRAATCLLNTNTLNLLERNRFTGWDLPEATEEQIDVFFDKILKQVHSILGEKSKGAVFVNFDARGYALKFKTEFAREHSIYSDFGGYGILAPDFSI